MLIIGHRGSAGTKPENSIAGLREAIAVDADMVEFDIRLTKDKIPVLAHDVHMYRTHRKFDFTARQTLSELQKLTAGSELPIVTLEQALKECYGNIFVNIEIKELRSVAPCLEIIKKFCKTPDNWDSLLLSSFNPLVLRSLRRHAPHSQLGMLHYFNPLGFIGWHRQLSLSAVGFHRLHINSFALEVAKQLDLFTYAYTVNRPSAARRLAEQGIDGVVTDCPADVKKALARFNI